MSLDGYTTIQSQQIKDLASELAKRELPVIDNFEPIADFEELYAFSEAHPTPIEFNDQYSAWRLESVAARVIEAIGIIAHEPLNEFGWRSLTKILLEHVEYLYTYPEAPSAREKLAAGSALALASCVCASLPQAELWSLAGFGRIAATLDEASPTSSDTHVIQPLESAFELAKAKNLPILGSALDCYNKVLSRSFTVNHRSQFPVSDQTFIQSLNLELNGLEKVKTAVIEGDFAAVMSEYTDYRELYSQNYTDLSYLEKTDTYNTAKSYYDCLLQLTIYPTPAILGTTEIGIAALLFPEFRFSQQLLTLASRCYKWILNGFFYPDGFHKDRSIRSQINSISDFSRFLQTYEKTQPSVVIPCYGEIKTLLGKQLDACTYICQPDLTFPSFDPNVSNSCNVAELCGGIDIHQSNIESDVLSHALPYTGYYVMRDSGESDAQYLCFNSNAKGELGYEDKMSFVMYAHGSQLITHELPNSVRNSSATDVGAYNIVHIDGHRQKPELDTIPNHDTRWITTSTFDFVEDWYKTSDYQHKRSIFYVKGEYFILHDLILGEGEHTLEHFFNLGAELKQFTTPQINQNISQVWTQDPDRSNIYISSVCTNNLSVELNGNTLTYRVQSELPAVLNVVMIPMKTNIEYSPTVQSISVRTDADVLATGFSIASANGTDIVLISDDGYAEIVTSEEEYEIEFEGEYLFLRGDNCILLNGSYLKLGSKILVELDEPHEYFMDL